MRALRATCGVRGGAGHRPDQLALGVVTSRVRDRDRPGQRCEARPATPRAVSRGRLIEEVELSIPQWQHRLETDAGGCTVTLSGEVDMGVAGELAELLAVAAGSAEVRVDLAYVTFIDCFAIGVLIRARQAARTEGRRFVVRGATGHVRRVLEVTGALTILSE